MPLACVAVLLLKVLGMLPGERKGITLQCMSVSACPHMSVSSCDRTNVGRTEDGFFVDSAQGTQACSPIPLLMPPHGQLQGQDQSLASPSWLPARSSRKSKARHSF